MKPVRFRIIRMLVVLFAGAVAQSTQAAETIVFETDQGAFTLELYPDKAPQTVANFLQYVDAGFYDGTLFHRVVPGFVVQGGGFDKDLQMKKTRAPVKNESANRLKNTRGTVSMARRMHPDTATSQFYINLADNSNLDYRAEYAPGYTVFGRISDGMEVIDKIAAGPTHNKDQFRHLPQQPVVVVSARRSAAAVGPTVASAASLEVSPDGERFVAGQHYTVLPQPVPPRDASRIEVVEMFSYGCPHCFEFEPVLKEWSRQQSRDVDFWFFPAVWSEGMRLYARAFYTAQKLNVAEIIHVPLFTALTVEHRQIVDQQDMAEFFASYGVAKGAFDEAFGSDEVSAQLREAEARMQRYRPAGVPEIVINGKYRIDRMHAGGLAKMIQVADFLIEKERAEHKAAMVTP